jgi:hypothetical protein
LIIAAAGDGGASKWLRIAWSLIFVLVLRRHSLFGAMSRQDVIHAVIAFMAGIFINFVRREIENNFAREGCGNWPGSLEVS